MRAAYRIALIFATAFAVAFSALGVTIYIAADMRFQAMRDRDIAREVNELADENTRARMLDEIAEREAEKVGQRYGYALFDIRSGQRLSGAMHIAMPQPGIGWATADNRTGAAALYRIRTLDMPYGDRLVIGLDSAAIEAIDKTILALFAIAFGVVIVISAAGGVLLGRYLNRRLDPVAATARAIMAGDLGQRVPLSGRDDEFEQTARAINDMLERIVHLMKNLRQVSGDIAHDLRTPLMRLRGALDRLGEDPDAAERAIREGDAVLSLFDAILRINEVEGGALAESFERIDLSRLIADLGDTYAPAFTDEARKLDVNVAPGLAVLGHHELLAQAVVNLLDNSRLHTPEGTRVALSLSLSDGLAVIVVSDNGPGIAPADRDRMLGRFVRGDSSRTTRGSGLGLSLALAVAKAHRGEITLEDAMPGLAVRMALPLNGPPQTTSGQGPFSGIGSVP